MALIKCPECGKEISDCAMDCPNCGYPLNSQNYFVPNNTPVKREAPKDSVLSVIAAVFAFFTITSFIGLIIGLIDLGINDKKCRHLGSWFAVIYAIAVCGAYYFIKH